MSHLSSCKIFLYDIMNVSKKFAYNKIEFNMNKTSKQINHISHNNCCEEFVTD